MQKPLVSIVCITYNHEPFLRRTLEGFLMQETTFPVEIILAEDCSTDGTRAICEEFAAKYPEIIRYIWSETNVGAVANERRAMKAARGKYIAFCEGDDYWTIPDKLQRQVDFLETHPDYSASFHRCKHYDFEKGILKDDTSSEILRKGQEGVDISEEEYFFHWYTQPLTMVFRVSCLDLDDMLKYRYYRDMHQIYHLLKSGKCYVHNFYGGVRVMHSGGMISCSSSIDSARTAVAVAEEIYRFNRFSEPKKYYMAMLLWNIAECKKRGINLEMLRLNCRLFFISKNCKQFVRLLIKD